MNGRATTVPQSDARQKLLLKLLRAQAGQEKTSGEPRRVPRVSRQEDLPLSFTQERLWFLHRLEPRSSMYNLPASVRFRGALDLRALELSLDEVVRRHETLRTTFRSLRGTPVQVIAPPSCSRLPRVDLDGLAEPDRRAHALRLVAREALRPFDLSAGPLFRTHVLRLAANEHVLSFNLHHIVADGWSRRLLIREVAALYEAFSQGRPSPLAELPVQFVDFVCWQRERLRGEVLEAHLEYWRDRLRGDLPVLDLPTDRPHGAGWTSRSAAQPWRLPGELSSRLKELASRRNASLFMVLLAIFKALIFRSVGQPDIVVGTPVAGREQAETEGLIGCFIQTLVLRTDLSGTPSFEQLLGRVREVVLGAFSHQEVPFDKLLDELRPERDRGRATLFQLFFNMLSLPEAEARFPGLTVELLRTSELDLKFELTLSMAETRSGLAGGWEFSPLLFDATTMRRMAGRFTTMSWGVALEPGRSLSELPLLGLSETHQLLWEWNDTRTEDPGELRLPDLFESQVARTPSAVAVVFEDLAVSYGELGRRAGRLARHLVSLGVGPEVRVGISMERSAAMVEGLLAISKAGGAYVPLDPGHPAERLGLMAADAGIRVLLVARRRPGEFPGYGGVVVEAQDAPGASGGSRLSAGAPADSLAYVIYTSGSTGKPKGVQISHRALVNFLLSMGERPGLASRDTWLAVTTLSFDIAGLEIFLPLVTGARLVLAGRETASDGRLLSARLESSRVSVMQATPATWQLLLDSGWQGLGGLKVLCGGEALTAELAERLRGKVASIWNLYGPTETTIWSSVHELDPASEAIPIGRPIASTWLRLLDRRYAPVPLGAVGELGIGGRGLARGYLGQRGETAQRFVPDAFAAEAGARLYRSGDLARQLPDGRIRCLGRVDHQIKLRGFRIEPGEIEAALRRLDGVRQAVVAVREQAPGARSLVAYVVPGGRGASPPSVPDGGLERSLRELLPGYMVPSVFVVLEAMPLTPTGKIDRKALPAPVSSTGTESYVAPRGPVEEIVASIWSQVLGAVRIGVHDDFFELGGHSLLATQVVSRVREALGVELPLRTLFEARTVGGFSAALEMAMRVAGGGGALPPLEPVARDRALPLSFAQERMWFLHQLDPKSPAYNLSAAVRLGERLDVEAVEASLTHIVRRHEVLRTVFPEMAGEPRQEILASAPFRVPVVDLKDLPGPERRSETWRLAGREGLHPFDLARGPLLRATLVALESRGHALFLTMHHIASDAWSMDILVRELTSIYASLARREAPALPELPVQYADFAVWQRRWLEGGELERQMEYWRRALAEAPTLELPYDRPRPPVQSYRGAVWQGRAGAELTAALTALGRERGATLFMVLLAAWTAHLARLSGQDEVVVGSPVANRDRTEVEGLVGLFVNTLVMRVRLAGNPSFRQLLATAREVALKAYAHQDLPFNRLVDGLWIERKLDRSPLFQVMLSVLNMPQESVEVEGLTLSVLPFETSSAKFDLTLTVAESDAGLACRLEYSTALFDITTSRRWLSQFHRLLAEIGAAPDRPLAQFALLSRAQRHQVEVEWNAATAAPPEDACLATLFERQVARRPDAVAAVFEERRLSYRELDRRACFLADALRRKGVGPEAPVGFLVDRSLMTLEGLWGILKAGGAYVPLDPRTPRRRLELLLARAGISVLVSAGEPPSALELPAGTEAIVLDGPPKAGPAPALPARGVRPQNPAYVIYTSGSTGTPKGVVVEHRQIVAYLRGVARRIRWAPEARFALLQPITVDLSKTVLYPPLLGGGCLELIAEERTLDGRALAELLRRHRVDVIKITPSHLAALGNSPDPDAVLPQSRLVVGGEASRLDVMSELAGRSRCQVFNHYGPTEATVGALAGRVDEGLRAGPTGTVPIGRPMDHSQAFVLGRRLEPPPLGAPGELCLGGASVARGYLGRPALTAARFVPAPGGARLYRTGDLARHLGDGRVELLGRIDDQVKVRGYRVEPGEVEAAICAYPEVAEALVALREIGAGGPQLVGYVVARDGADADVGALRGFLRSRLPEHMVPAAFVVLPGLPRMAHGKVDRRALPPPAPRGAAAGPPPAPRSPTEELVAGIWMQVLGLDEVGVEDDFFDIGGHSLLATQVVSRLRRSFAADVSLRQLFRTPTLGGLASALDAGWSRGRAAEVPPIRPVPRTGAPPLSFAQERLWLIDRLIPGSSAYNIAIALRLAGDLEIHALARSVNEVARRHEILRTTFAEAADGPVQVIAPAVPRPLPQVDLSGLGRETYEAELERLAGEEGRRPFDLGTGPLWRAVLLRCARRQHVLLVVLHHIVSDGWSRGVLVREFGALYPAFARGERSPLAELPVQYADFACWQRAWLAGEELERQLGYWRRRLAGAPAALELPTDRPRPRVPSHRGASLGAKLGHGLAGGLAALGREAGATLFMTLLASWASLLSRYSGQDDIVVGTPVANRTRPEIEGLIGFFINTLVMRTDVSGSPSLRQTLDRVRRGALEAYAHQDLPFDRLVEELGVHRALDRTPLFQVMLVLQNAPRADLKLADLRLENWQPEIRTAKFDLTLSAGETESGLGVALEYSLDLLDATTAVRLLAHYRRLLEAAVADPEKPVAELPLLGPAERHALRGEWNDTASPYPGTRPIHELFETRAGRIPERLAVVYGEAALSYAELARRADRLARFLEDHGVGAGSRVGLCVERSPEMVVGMLGTLEAGGAYVPLDPTYPRERLAFMMRDARLRMILTQERLAAELPRSEAPVLRLDGEWPAVAASGSAASGTAVQPDDLAYVIYTSGSTGTPKGVAVAHRAVVRLVLETDYVRLTGGERLAQASNASFDAATFEIWGALLNGGVLVGAARDVVLSPGELAGWFRERRIDVAFLTTALFNQVSREAPAAFAGLRDLMFGGEAVDPGRVRAVLAAGPPSRLLHVYGPTENTTFSSWYRVGSVAEGAVTVPIGRPIANSRAYVLDGRLQPVPLGVAGELFVAGDGLAREYLGREELTRERFVATPGRPGERLYKTGDVVRLLPDGNIVFQGRRDDQVKLRGFRIELGEVESVLGDCPAVREAVILLREDLPAGRGLVGYVVPAGAAADAGELRSFLGRRLPGYMVPASFVVLESLPLTANGKVDRAALLRAPLPLPPSATGAPGRALTPVGEILADIFADVLGADRVAAGENFFELGGHSLIATRLVSRVRRTLGVHLALRELFENPTVEGLAEIVETRRAAGAASRLPPILRAPRDRALPLSFAQERLWFLDQLEPASSAYNVPVALRIAGELSIGVFERSLLALVHRHETLRTTIRTAGGSAAQVIGPAPGQILSVVDLTALDRGRIETETRRRTASEASRPFDLTAGPLFRATLLRCSGEEHVLILALHHIVTDGWSMGLLIREMVALYRELSGGFRSSRPVLPALEIQYADFAAWQRQRLAEDGEALAAELAYWKGRLGDAPPLLELPTDRPRAVVTSPRGSRRQLGLPRAALAGLRGRSRRDGATLFMTLLAAFQVLLGRYTGQDDISVGTPVAGRTRVETEPLIGFFVNTLVLRTDLSGDPRFSELLGRVRRVSLEAHEHQELSFEKLVAELQPERTLSQTPLFQVMFALQNAPSVPLELPGLTFERLSAGSDMVKFDLSVSLTESGGGLVGALEYRRDLFDATRMARLASHYQVVLEAVAAQRDLRVSELPLLGKAERHQLLEWSAGEAAELVQAAPEECLEAWAERAPDRLAVTFEDESLSYGELDRRARGLAGALGRHDVARGALVGLCAERSLEMVVGLLGIWKAGAAFVPLEPSYPARRLAFMIADSSISLVLSTPAAAVNLPGRGIRVVRLDAAVSDGGAVSFLPRSQASDPAYVIYTSGTTGVPKGVLVEHGHLRSTLAAAQQAFAWDASDYVPCLAPFSFDIFLFELLNPLLVGATVVLLGLRPSLDLEELTAVLPRATRLHAVPAVMRQVVAAVRERGLQAPLRVSLRTLFVGGDRVPGRLLKDLREVFPESRVHVLYGPTEGTIICSSYAVPPGDEAPRPWLGRALAHAELRLCDGAGRRVPIGVVGEIYLGGAGVTRGYLGQEALTAEKYPILEGRRFFRTGDLARYQPDGNLEFVGRGDQQVKVRGLRIEPGEIESVLVEDARVREALVIVRDDEAEEGDRSLVAYLVKEPGSAKQERLELWPSIGEYFVYDELIYHGLSRDEARNALYRAALAELVRDKVVVDLGTGSEAVLARMCVELGARRVYALELLEESCRAARETLELGGLTERIILLEGDARQVELPEKADVCVSEIVEAIGGAEGAAVLLNDARRFLKPGGQMVPSRSLTRVAAARLPEEIPEPLGFTEVSAHYVRKIFDEVGHPFDLRLCIKNFPSENLISNPAVFEDLDFRGPTEPEYRLPIRLTIERDSRLDGLLVWLSLELGPGLSLDILDGRYAWFPVFLPVFFPGIEVSAGDVIEAVCEAKLSSDGVHPDYFLEGELRQGDGERRSFAFASVHHAERYGENPFYRELFADGEIPVLPDARSTPDSEWIAGLRLRLRERVPEYMVPSAFVVLEELPLTPSGKPDRGRLPAPQRAVPEPLDSAAPRAPVEEILAGIWEEVLGVENVGTGADFFELGGHSLLATRMVSRLRRALSVEISLQEVFTHPTLGGLARAVSQAKGEGRGGRVPAIRPTPRHGGLPLSFAQQRLWFLDQLSPGSAAYNIPTAVRIVGRLDVGALGASFREIVRRHEALRTTFPGSSGDPLQVIVSTCATRLPQVDLTCLPAEQRRRETRRLARREARLPFELASGPLLRTTLVALSDEEHVVLLSLHHIVADGWSMGLWVREMAAHYEELSGGAASPPPALPALEIQYADFAVWQRQRLAEDGEMLAAELAYWRERLGDAPPLLELPTDRPRAAVPSSWGSRRPLGLPRATLAELRGRSRREGATLFMTLLAAFQVLLGRYTGQDDISVGTPIAGRTQVETEPLIGLFVNTLVLRTDLSGDPRFSELLGRVRRVSLEAHEHQELPFEKLVAELQPERKLSQTPLFQVMFALQNAPSARLELAGLTFERLSVGSDTVKFDLTVSLSESGDGLFGALEYRRDLFDATRMARFASHYQVLLEAVAAGEDLRISELPLFGRAERHQLLEWSASLSHGSSELCLADLFEEQVGQTPEAVALTFERSGAGIEMQSYGELNVRANRLTDRLLSLGVGPDRAVGLYLERSPEMVVAVLGVVKAGGCYVPLEPGYPAARLAFLVEDSAISTLVTRRSLAPRVAGCGARLVEMDGESEVMADVRPEDPASRAAPANLAYVIYTSGSTGTPKGVGIPQAAVVKLVTGTDYVRLGPSDRVAHASNVAFDAATFELWGALLNGGCLVGLDREETLSPYRLADRLRSERVTALFLTTALFNEVSREHPGAFGEVDHLLFGGEAVTPRWVREVLRQGPERSRFPGRLLHVYGPTESTTFSTWWRVDEVSEVAWTIPIGRPLNHTCTYVVDGFLFPVAIGVPGELTIGGARLARGYQGRPAETAQRFVPDLPAREPGRRLYRTGDLVRWQSGGVIEFLGRFDWQVKIRGFRIEPGEVEAALEEHGELDGAVVLARPDPSGNPRLLAYVVPSGDRAPTSGELRRFLLERLPEYMVPPAFVSLSSLPLTVNGKVDRGALPEVERLPDSISIHGDRSPAEELVAGMFSDLLAAEHVDSEQDFFESGGHSLLATQIVSRVRATFGVELPVRTVFEAPTVRELAARVLAASQIGEQAAPAIEPVSRARSLPLSFAQRRLWFLDQLEPGSAAYNIPIALRMRGRLRVAALDAGLRETVRRHEVLRTTFPTLTGEPVQRIAADAQYRLPVVDLSALAGSTGAAVLTTLVAAHANRPFDLAQGPLMRAMLVKLGERDHALLLTIHHIVGDGWSMGVLGRELGVLYEAFSENRPSPLPELSIQYADFASWQRQRLVGEALEEKLRYFRQQLEGAPRAIELPADRPRPAVQTFRGAESASRLSRRLSDHLRVLSRQEGVTLFMALLTAFDVLLHRLSGQRDVVVGIPVAGRQQVEVEGLIGLFVNTLALRTRLPEGVTARQLFAQVREVTLGAYARQEVPIEMLLNELEPERDLSRTPLFQVFFNMLNLPTPQSRFPGLALQLVSSPEVESKFDLTVYASEEAEGIRFRLLYNADLFDARRMEELLDQYELVLRQIAESPDEPIERLSLVTPRARDLLPNPAEELPAGAGESVHQTFVSTARRFPDRIAVFDPIGEWSYDRLDARSDRVARILHRDGIRPGDIVAVHASRSAELVCALLGVLKAGAAFLVLDPAYPARRIIGYLGYDEVRGWIRCGTDGALPEELETFVRERSWRCRLRLTWRARLDEGKALAKAPRDRRRADAGRDQPAHVVFTSGSTGVPKAVAASHLPLAHFQAWYWESFGLSTRDRFTMLSGLAHDPLLRDVFTPLRGGASLHIPSDEALADPAETLAWMARERVTVTHLTPAFLRFLCGVEPAEAVTTLRHALMGGDVLTRRDALRLQRIAPGAVCTNFYGATETPQAIASFTPVRPAAHACAAVPLGRGIDGVQLLVLGPGGGLAGIGELGEICVRTPYLALGYLGDETSTRECFLTNPWTEVAADRIYRTGDLGRYLPGGDVSFVGRADRQLKVRGFRVEPAEIESVLLAHPMVREALVVAREQGSGQTTLSAHVAVAEGTEPASLDLRRLVERALPRYMVPGTFHFLSALPRTPNGKVDVDALSRCEEVAPDAAAEHRTPVEEMLLGIFSELLGADRIEPESDFFLLGGHSLLATLLVSRVRELFATELPVRAVFEAPTVSGLAMRIESELKAGRKLRELPIERVSGAGPFPLSFAQQRLWFFYQLEPHSSIYNMPIAFQLSGEVDLAALRKSFFEIVRRHETLRTVFPFLGGKPVQMISAPAPPPLPIFDLTGLPPEARQRESQRLRAEEARRPFDLVLGPVFRVCLIRLGDGDEIVAATLHHISSDGWSMGILAREVSELYAAFSQGLPSPLRELPFRYADFSSWQRRFLSGESLAAELAHWKGRLAGAPAVLELPGDYPRPAVQTFGGAIRSRRVPEELASSLRLLGRRRGTTSFMTLLAAFAILLRHYTGRDDIVVGTDVANRNRRETEPIIGFFVNQLVLRLDLSGKPSFLDLLDRVRTVCVEAHTHQDLPFEKLTEALLKEGRDPAHAPVFQVKFIQNTTPRESLDLTGVTLRRLEGAASTAHLDLTMATAETPAGLFCALNYRTDIFLPSTIDKMLEHYERTLSLIAERPERGVDDLQAILKSAEAENRTMQSKRRREADFSKLRQIKPRAVSVAEGELVEESYLEPGQRLPLVVRPKVADFEPVQWARDHRSAMEDKLLEHGAILFRGFGIDSAPAFERFAKTFCHDLFNENGEHPRESVSGDVYTPVFYPPDQKLLWHNENSFNSRWPMKIMFCCVQPAEQGGETPIVDSRRVFDRLSPELRRRFVDRQVMYVRNYGDGFGLSWKDVFQTSSRSELEEICRRDDIRLESLGGERLRTCAVRPSAVKHPKTGDMSWFNQAQHFHVSCLDAETRKSIQSLFAEGDMPRNCYYGDGSVIADTDMDEILKAYRELEISFHWQKGDVLLLDNVLVAHGRNPFVGQRKLLVAMGEMRSYDEL